jgi:hypothetical protein
VYLLKARFATRDFIEATHGFEELGVLNAALFWELRLHLENEIALENAGCAQVCCSAYGVHEPPMQLTLGRSI